MLADFLKEWMGKEHVLHASLIHWKGNRYIVSRAAFHKIGSASGNTGSLAARYQLDENYEMYHHHILLYTGGKQYLQIRIIGRWVEGFGTSLF
jgi:hypothetical protein